MKRLASLLFLAPAAAFSQMAPDAGQLLQQLGPPPVLSAPKSSPTRIEEKRPDSPADEARIAVKAFLISGAHAIPVAELQALIADSSGKELTLADIDVLALRITRYYREAGYLVARAYVPAQEINNGVLEIAVLEGVLGKVEIENRAGIGGAALATINALQTGAALRNETLESSLLPLSDLPGIEVRTTLRPGETIGASDLLVEVQPGRMLTGSIDLDNFGNRFTGAYRLGGNFSWNNPAGLGDQISVRAQGSDEEMTYLRLGYHLPVGPRGMRVGLAWSEMRYLLGKDFAVLNADGRATTASLYAQHPLLRRRDANLFVALQYDGKSLLDRIGATNTDARKSLDSWTVSLQGAMADDIAGGGMSSALLSWTTGRLEMDRDSATIDQVSARSKGQFDRWNFALNRTQRLTDRSNLFLSWTAQGTRKNLSSSEKFSLGGAQGIRAYPQGEGTGDEGRLLSAEFRWQLSDTWQALAFYDDGRVKINHSPWTTETNHRRLAGTGLGINYANNGFTVKIFTAWKAGTGKPTSDIDRSPRLWAQAIKVF